jgi:hypothetical protein
LTLARTFESYQILDAFVGWRASDQRWDLSVCSKYLTDEYAVLFQQGPDAYDIAVSGGSYTQTNTIPERSFRKTARYNF